MTVKNRNIFLYKDDDIPVSLLIETGSLFRLYLIGKYPCLRRIYKVIKIIRRLSAMLSGEIAFRSLDGRRKLDHIHIAGLDLGLHKEIKLTLYHLADNAKITYLILYDERLLTNDAVVLNLLITCQLEERIIFISDVTGVLVIIPETVIRKINLLNIDMKVLLSFLYPVHYILHTVDVSVRIFPGSYYLVSNIHIFSSACRFPSAAVTSQKLSVSPLRQPPAVNA